MKSVSDVVLQCVRTRTYEHIFSHSLFLHIIFYFILCQTRSFFPTDSSEALFLQCKWRAFVVLRERERARERERKRRSVSNLINSNLTFYRTRLFEWRWWCFGAFKMIIINTYIPSLHFMASNVSTVISIRDEQKFFACMCARLLLLPSYLFAYFFLYLRNNACISRFCVECAVNLCMCVFALLCFVSVL